MCVEGGKDTLEHDLVAAQHPVLDVADYMFKSVYMVHSVLCIF